MISKNLLIFLFFKEINFIADFGVLGLLLFWNKLNISLASLYFCCKVIPSSSLSNEKTFEKYLKLERNNLAEKIPSSYLS